MIKELFLATVFSTSFSIRTPNDVTKPLDYEFSTKIENHDGDFTYTVKRDWERQLGEKYIDDVFKINQNINTLYIGFDYVDKPSKDIKYKIYNLGVNHNSGLKIGVSRMDNQKEPLLNVGYGRAFRDDVFEYNLGISTKYDFVDNTILNVESEVKKWFGKFNVFGLYKHEYYNKKEDFQFKIGFGFKL